MARPSFVVQHFVFCASVEYPDVRRPYRDSTLNGVDYVFQAPPNTEFPFAPDEFWLFARFYSVSDVTGDTRPLTVSCVQLGDDEDQEVEVWRRDIGPIRFSLPAEVIDRAWAFRNGFGPVLFDFPAPGRYVFRLSYPTRSWPFVKVKAEEYIRVEVGP